MPTYVKGKARQLSAVDPKDGRKMRFDLPHTTDDPAEIRALKSARAEVTSASKSKPKPVKESDSE